MRLLASIEHCSHLHRAAEHRTHDRRAFLAIVPASALFAALPAFAEEEIAVEAAAVDAAPAAAAAVGGEQFVASSVTVNPQKLGDGASPVFHFYCTGNILYIFLLWVISIWSARTFMLQL